MHFLRDVVQSMIFAAAIYLVESRYIPMLSEYATLQSFARSAAWLAYWWFQGLSFTGIWVIGHECGHGAFSASQWINDVVGFITHTLMWTPYFSWRISHHRHHANHASMERDEVYVPKTKADLGIPDNATENDTNWSEYFEDTPIYTLVRLILQQLLAFPAYLIFNVSGQKTYPRWTNHFNPKSILFQETQFWDVIISNVGIGSMITVTWLACRHFGSVEVLKYYGIPWLGVAHWFVMITYLHHTTPYIPHYRKGTWTFVRGAAATVDRDFLGWQGRWFLHDVAHFHVVHHFFPMMPWYNGEEATQYLKGVLGPNYLSSNRPVFAELWRSYNECQFVDDSGEIVFYRNREGKFPAAER